MNVIRHHLYLVQNISVIIWSCIMLFICNVLHVVVYLLKYQSVTKWTKIFKLIQVSDVKVNENEWMIILSSMMKTMTLIKWYKSIIESKLNIDVLLKRRPDGSLQQSIYRKVIWYEKHKNMHDWVQLRRKRILIYFLSSRARWIWNWRYTWW